MSRACDSYRDNVRITLEIDERNEVVHRVFQLTANLTMDLQSALRQLDEVWGALRDLMRDVETLTMIKILKEEMVGKAIEVFNSQSASEDGKLSPKMTELNYLWVSDDIAASFQQLGKANPFRKG